MGKIRHVDLYPDEFLAAVSGEMSPAELGVYWMICLLHYSRGGEINHDLAWLRAKFRPGKRNQVIGDIIERLIMTGRVYQEGAEIGVRRCQEEIQNALRRVREASERRPRGVREASERRPRGAREASERRPRGAREAPEMGVSSQQYQSSREEGPLFSEKLTTNYQLPTTNEEEKAPWREPKRSTTRRQQVPVDWLPDTKGRQFARDRAGWPDSIIDSEAERFRDYHRQKGTLFADLSAGWRTWVTNGQKFQQERRNGQRPDPAADHARALDILARAAIEYDERQGRRGDPETTH